MSNKPPKVWGSPHGRFRERGGFSPGPDAFGIVNSNPNGEHYGSLSTGTYTATKDVVVPGYKARSALGQVFMNPYERVTTSYIGSGGSGRLLVRRDGNPGNIETSGPGAGSAEMRYFTGGFATMDPIFVLSGSDIGKAEQFVGTQVASQRGRSKNNLWEDLAEFDQTVGLLRHPLSAFTKFNKAFRRKNGLASEQLAADLWLQYKYGIAPLYQSITGIVEGLKKPRKVIRESSRGSANISDTLTTDSHFNDFNVSCDIHQTSEDVMVIRGLSLDEFYSDFGHNIGFSTKGFLTLPWELVRLSFVVDWFVNVGDFIGAHVPTIGFNQLGACMTIERTVTTTRSIANFDTNRPGYGDTWIPSRAPSFEYTTFYNSKKRTTLLPPGGIQLNPNFAFSSWQKVATAIALAIQSTGEAFSSIGSGRKGPSRSTARPQRGPRL
jgi:hypothetical protein